MQRNLIGFSSYEITFKIFQKTYIWLKINCNVRSVKFSTIIIYSWNIKFSGNKIYEVFSRHKPNLILYVEMKRSGRLKNVNDLSVAPGFPASSELIKSRIYGRFQVQSRPWITVHRRPALRTTFRIKKRQNGNKKKTDVTEYAKARL